MHWSIISLILCVFGFLKEFRPSEPFVTDYLTGSWKNFTREQVNQEIYPLATYFYFGTLILVFLLVDLIRYKSAIILCGAAGTATFVTLRYGYTIFHMQIVEFLYGLLLSTEVAYYTYIYAKVDKKHYQQVTSHTRVAFLLGRFMSGLVSQLTTSFGILDYEQLVYITILSLFTATIWAFLLPAVDQTIYFHQNNSENSTITSRLPQNNNTLHSATPKLWQHFIQAYTNIHIIKWSLWWSFATCGFLQVVSYIQLLWQTAVEKDSTIYNGAVEAIYTIISAVIVFFVGLLRFNWPLVGEGLLSIFSFFEGLLLILSSVSYNIWILYMAYTLFAVIYHSMITVASFEIAKFLSKDSYGLIFGFNTFLALFFQSMLTLITINWLALDIRTQFLVNGFYFIVLGFVFLITSSTTVISYVRKGKPLRIWLKESEFKKTDEKNESTSS